MAQAWASRMHSLGVAREKVTFLGAEAMALLDDVSSLLSAIVAIATASAVDACVVLIVLMGHGLNGNHFFLSFNFSVLQHKHRRSGLQ